MIYIIVKLTTIDNTYQTIIDKIRNLLDIKEYQLINILYYKLTNITSKDTAIVFGSDTALSMRAYFAPDKLIELPGLNLLVSNKENSSVREETHKKLLSIKDYINLKQNPETSIRLTISDLYNLRRLALEKNNKSFIFINSDGKTVSVNLDKVQDNSNKTDINIDFESLILARYAIETLELKDTKVTFKG